VVDWRALQTRIKCGTLSNHRTTGLKQRMHGRVQQLVVTHGRTRDRLEGRAAVGQPKTFLTEQAADRVLEGHQLRLQCGAGR
jgi:hypothetical protein